MPGTALAQPAYPDKPIHLIVAFVPGGATDTLARQIAERLQAALGQPVVIENRPGAGGYLAWNHVASSDPDGYTLMLAENALAISQALYKKSKSNFDPVTQYDAVAGIAVCAVGAGGCQQRAGQDRGGAGGLFQDRAAEAELRLRRRRQRLASQFRGVHGQDRHAGRPRALQGRRPGDRRRRSRATCR